MALHSGLDARHLIKMLGEHLHKEQAQWKPKTYKVTGNSDLVSTMYKKGICLSVCLSVEAEYLQSHWKL